MDDQDRAERGREGGGREKQREVMTLGKKMSLKEESAGAQSFAETSCKARRRGAQHNKGFLKWLLYHQEERETKMTKEEETETKGKEKRDRERSMTEVVIASHKNNSHKRREAEGRRLFLSYLRRLRWCGGTRQ